MKDKRLFDKLISFINKLSKHKTTVMSLAVAVVFVTTYLLILPALTLEKDEAIRQGGIDISVTEGSYETTNEISNDLAEEDVLDTSDEQYEDEQSDSDLELIEQDNIGSIDTQPTANDAPANYDPSVETDNEVVADPLYYEGEDYSVSVIDESGVLPEGTSVKVEEIAKDNHSEDYDNYYKEALTAIQNEEGGEIVKEISFARFYDITLMSNGDEIEPAEGEKVNVRIEYDKNARTELDIEDSENVRIVHFTENNATEELETEVLDAEDNSVLVETDRKDQLQAAEFETDSFSVYAIVYTVDFHWDVDGKKFDFSIPGGGYVSFSQLVELFGIASNVSNEHIAAENVQLTLDDVTVSDATERFVEDVENITFSSPELMSVSKVEEDTTVGAIKEALDLDCEYSGELTNEQINDINETEVQAGDWALISLKAFDTEEYLTVTLKSGESFQIKVTDASDPLGISGRTVAFVYLLEQPISGSNARAAQTKLTDNQFDLLSDLVTYQQADGLEYCSQIANAWMFEYVPDQDAYYVSNGYHALETASYYLTYDPEVEAAGQGSGLAFVNDKSQASPMKVSRNDDGTYKIYKTFMKNGVEHEKLLSFNPTWGGQTFNMTDPVEPGYTQGGFTYKESYSKIHFCLPENINGSHKASHTTAADLSDGQRVVVYQKVLQPDNTYLYYAIDYDGSLKQVYESSDSVYWKDNTNLSIEWELRVGTYDDGTPNGYYYLVNCDHSNVYLTPKADGSVVHSLTPEAAEFNGSINLPGKEAGNYTSRVVSWDSSNNHTYALDADTVQPNSGPPALRSSSFDIGDEFMFAVRDPIVQRQLTQVATVDSDSMGIKITMYDFNGTNTNSGRLSYQTTVMGNEGWRQTYLNQGGTGRTLQANGFPNTRGSNNNYTRSLESVFTANAQQGYTVNKTTDVNHLFLQSIYDSTGYFHYSSAENFAHLNTETKSFEVYEQLGVPIPNSGSGGDAGAAYMNRGNFMPYSELDLNNRITNNYEPTGTGVLPDTDPRKGEDLYRTKAETQYSQNFNNNYFFGMIMEADFIQGENGMSDHNTPMHYEFYGDDDMWVYIDDVLVLDVGGVHDAFRGVIDFQTGTVTVSGGTVSTIRTDGTGKDDNTTIKEMFWKARKFPDGSAWTNYNDPKVNDFFEENTFKDFSTHTFKMFYMERGAGASNLQLDFNLPVRTQNTFRVEKELADNANSEVQQSYANKLFKFRAFKADGSIINSAINTKTGEPIEFDQDGFFYLKAGEAAQFDVANEQTEYYVEEYDVEHYGVVFNSDNDTVIRTETDGTKTAVSPVSKQMYRGVVHSTNTPHDDVLNDLQIKKIVSGTPHDVSDEFEVYVYLESSEGKMVPYSLGRYYLKNNEGKYVTYGTGGQRAYQDTKPDYSAFSGQNGAIAGLRDGDTIIIEGLLEGTEFLVVERLNAGAMTITGTDGQPYYEYIGKTVVDSVVPGTLYYGANPDATPPEQGTLSDGAIDGSNENALVTILNGTGAASLQLKKQVTINDFDPAASEVSDKTVADGTYIININGKDGTATAGKSYTVKITITNGVASSATIKDNTVSGSTDTPATLENGVLEIPDMIPGEYTVTEDVDSKTVLSSITSTDNSAVADLDNRKITITLDSNSSNVQLVTLTNNYADNSETDIAHVSVRKTFAGIKPGMQLPENFNIKVKVTATIDGQQQVFNYTLKDETDTANGVIWNQSVNADGDIVWDWKIAIRGLTPDAQVEVEENNLTKPGYDVSTSANPGGNNSTSYTGTVSSSTVVQDKAAVITDKNSLVFPLTDYGNTAQIFVARIIPSQTSLVISKNKLNLSEKAALEAQLHSMPNAQDWYNNTVPLYYSFEDAANHKITVRNNSEVTYSETTPGDPSTGQIVFDKKCQWNMVATVTLTYVEGRPADFNFVNSYTETGIDLDIFKFDATDMSTPLKKAQFRLKKLDPDGRGTYITGDEAIEKTSGETDAQGKTSITGITTGYYEISEIKIPDGYVLLEDERFYIRVNDGVIRHIVKTSDDPDTDIDESIVKNWSVVDDNDDGILRFTSARPATADIAATNATFKVGNTPGAALPNAGGIGTTVFYIIGSMLVLGCGIYLISRRRIRS